MTQPKRQVYGSWDEAMADPELDLARPWFVAPPVPAPVSVSGSDFDWSGWQSVGQTNERADVPAVFAARREDDDKPEG